MDGKTGTKEGSQETELRNGAKEGGEDKSHKSGYMEEDVDSVDR